MKPYLTAIILVLLSVTAVMAQQDPSLVDAASPEEPISVLTILLKGGKVIMIPLAILSFIAVLLIMFYFLTIRQGAVVSSNFMNAATGSFMTGFSHPAQQIFTRRLATTKLIGSPMLPSFFPLIGHVSNE